MIMEISKEQLGTFREQYGKARALLDEPSNNVSEAEKLQSHDAAREIFTEMQLNLQNLLQDESAPNAVYYRCILAKVLLELGSSFVVSDETSTGESFLKRSTVLLESNEYCLLPEAINTYIEALIELSFLNQEQKGSGMALKQLENAENTYKKFRESKREAFCIADILNGQEVVKEGEGDRDLEKLYTKTLFYMMQVHANNEELEQSSYYCNHTLRRQLASGEYEAIDWALNVATLSQFYLRSTIESLTTSRHHLSAATYILDTYKTKMITDDMTDEQKDAETERFRHRYADIARCWAKYGIFVLNFSKERLLQDNEEPETGKPPQNLPVDISYRFEDLPLKDYEDQIESHPCLVFEDAYKVFRNAHKWLQKAMEYYSLESAASEYAYIVQDVSLLYSSLLFFVANGNEQCKIQKLRIEALEQLVQELNPTYYMTICREVWNEVGLIYLHMLDIKLDAIHDLDPKEHPSPHAINKINNLAKNSIEYLTKYVDSFKKENETDVNFDKLGEESKCILNAYICLGRIYSKIITTKKQYQIFNVTHSLKYYELFVTEGSKTEELEKMFAAELSACRKMVVLLPQKLNKLVDEMQNE